MKEKNLYPGSLHNHSDYSNVRLRDSIISIQNMIDYAIELNYTTLALTDHSCLSGHLKAQKYYNKIKKSNPNFKLILGDEIYLIPEEKYKVSKKEKFYHLILLAVDLEGHRQLREISTKSWLQSYMSGGIKRVPTYYNDLIEIIGENKGHIICLSGCLGSLSGHLAKENMLEKLEEYLVQMNELFGKGNFYLEMQPPLKDGNEQDIYNHTLLSFSEKLKIPYIVSTDSHYLKKEDSSVHRAYLRAQQGEREVDEFYATTYMMGTDELENYFLNSTIDLELAYKNIQEIANRCNDYDLSKPLKIPELLWKSFNPKKEVSIWYKNIPYMKIFYESDYRGDKVLAEAIAERLEWDTTLQNKETYNAINECLDMTWESSNVNKTHWSAYFLNLQKIIDTCWEAGSLVGVARGCFYPGMKVTIKNGQTKNIEDIKVGDEVFTHLGRAKAVYDTKKYLVDEDMYHLSIQGTDDIICTNNHKILAIPNILCKYKDNCVFSCKRKCSIKNELKPKWVEAKDLKPNDMVAIPKYKYEPKKFNYIDLANYTQLIHYCTYDEEYIYTYKGNNYKNIRNKYKRFIPIDKEFMYFLGVFIGDGWVVNSDNYNRIGIAFNSSTEKDQKSQDRIEKYLDSLGLKTSIRKNLNGKKVNQLYFSNSFLGKFLKEKCGDGVLDKHIPDDFLYNNREEMESLLEGLLNSDGNMNKKNVRISYDTINFNLANQVRNLLSYLGLYASIKTRPAYNNFKESYKVSSSGEQLSFLSFLDFSGSKTILQRDENYFYPRVKEIKKEKYKGYVYDLSIKDDTSYVVNNIAVHNSGAGFILLYILDITQINPLREKTPTYPWRSV